MALVNEAGEPVSQLAIGERFGVRMRFEVFEPIDDAVVELGISGADGIRVLTVHNVDRDGTPFALDPGTYEIHAWLGRSVAAGRVPDRRRHCTGSSA